MSRRALLAFIAMFVPAVVGADEPPPTVLKVITTDGKPAVGAKVWAFENTGAKDEPVEPKPFVTDGDGKLSVPTERRAARQIYARDADGRIGSAWLSMPWGADDPKDEIRVVLVATVERTGRITTADGKPVAGATVAPASYYAQNNVRRGTGGPSSSIGLPAWERDRLAVRTDAEGRFKLLVPAGYSVWYELKAEGFGESRWSASPDVDLDMKLAVRGSVTVTVVGIEPAHVKTVDLQLSASDAQPANTGIRESRHYTASADATGKVTFPSVTPGKYELGVIGVSPRVPGTFEKGPSLDVTSGATTAATAKFGPAAKIVGRVVDKSGKGLADVDVVVNRTDGQSSRPQNQLHVTTDKGGAFTAFGPEGWYMFWVPNPPDGYVEPAPVGPRHGWPEPVKIEAGKSHEFRPVVLLTAVTFVGKVVAGDGKPVGGAQVRVGWLTPRNRTERITTDKDGLFTIKNLPPDDAVAPRVRFGKAVNVPQTFELEKTTGPVTFEVREENAVAFKGRVVDGKGKPVRGATVHLRHVIEGVGRNTGFSTHAPIENATTDVDGRYSFAGYWPGRYGVYVTASGCSDAEVNPIAGEAGAVREFPDVRLVRANLTVSGSVVGTAGKPIGGAELYSTDGPTRFATTSAADGTFTLTGFQDGAAFVIARKAGYRLAAVPVFPANSDRVTVVLRKVTDPPAEAPPVPASHRKALDAFTRHALTLVWDTHATFGYGGNALADMARIDLDIAKKWRDEEKKRTDGKTDFTWRIDAVERQKTLFATAREDIDEALAIIGGLKTADGFSEALRVSELMLAVDKPKAQRLAEEAVVKARQMELPSRIWSLAQAGDLALRAGSAGGKKVVIEAAELAAQLPADRRGINGLAIGLAAAHLAPYDWPKAEAMLNALKDPGDYNRYLTDATVRIARTDLDRARKLFERFKSDNSSYPQEARVRVALVITQEKPDEAVKLVNSATDPPYRFLGLIQLAVAFHTTDKARAVKSIDAAFDLLDANPDAFRSWSNFGGAAGLAAVGAVRAKEIGYPDVASLVARTLALRPSRQYESPEEYGKQSVNIAAVLALVDPAAARHVLAGVAPPDEFVTRALDHSRDWLFALALADPERATLLADKLIERAKTSRSGRNGLSETGLVELGSILTARDRLRMLGMYGNLPREIEDE